MLQNEAKLALGSAGPLLPEALDSTAAAHNMAVVVWPAIPAHRGWRQEDHSSGSLSVTQ